MRYEIKALIKRNNDLFNKDSPSCEQLVQWHEEYDRNAVRINQLRYELKKWEKENI